MTKDTEQLSEQDREDLQKLGIDPDTGHVLEDEEHEQFSLLRMWSEVLAAGDSQRDEPVTIGVAGKIVASWPFISFQETKRFHELYFEVLGDMRALLEEIIRDNPGAADIMSNDDMKENYDLYKQLVIDWNIRLDELERAWEADAPDSHIWYAVLHDVRGVLFGRTGLAGHLEARNFELSADEVTHALQVARGEQ